MLNTGCWLLAATMVSVQQPTTNVHWLLNTGCWLPAVTLGSAIKSRTVWSSGRRSVSVPSRKLPWSRRQGRTRRVEDGAAASRKLVCRQGSPRRLRCAKRSCLAAALPCFPCPGAWGCPPVKKLCVSVPLCETKLLPQTRIVVVGCEAAKRECACAEGVRLAERAMHLSRSDQGARGTK